MVSADHSSQLETRLGRRWEQATAAGPEAARPARGRGLVRVDGWFIEDWLARRAPSHPDGRCAITNDATDAVDPTRSAAQLLALRTQLVARGALDR